jgi:hypothetical protein
VRSAVDGDDVGIAVAQGLDPGHKAGFEQLRVKRIEDIVERVMGGQTALIG